MSLGAVAVLGLSACGDDDSSTDATTTPPVTTATATSEMSATSHSTDEPLATDVSSSSDASSGTDEPNEPNEDMSPEEVTAAYYAAIGANDGETACALLSEDGFRNVGTDPENCADDLSSLPADLREVWAEVEIVGEVLVESEQCDPGDPDAGYTAVEVTARGENDCTSLELEDGHWRIEDV